MRQEPIQRQIALVSYGTQFLRKELELDKWYRHGIFFGARFQFREAGDNVLLADDFTVWLGSLAQAGATRLSLHLASSLGLDRTEYAVAVHFPDRYQVWAVGEERATWEDHEVPSAASYAGDVDCYWRVEDRPGALEVPGTDWRQLAAAIAADLEIAVPSSQVPAGPYHAHVTGCPPWADMPLFVAAEEGSRAHGVLATLYREQAKFANDTHPKNENSQYHYMGAEAAAVMDHWGERLEGWIAEVELRCANDYPGIAHEGGTLRRLREPPPPLQPEPQPNAEAVAAGPAAGATAPAHGKWKSAELVFLIALLSLIIVAFAKVIAGFPWLAIFFGMPWALYRHYKD